MAGMEILQIVEYIYNGFVYKITATEDIHKRLDDTEFFLNYIQECANVVEIKPLEEKQNVPLTVKAFSWNSENTKLLITEYGKYISEFRNPKMKKKITWGKIKEVFHKMNYMVCEEDLDRKMRNLKHHYKTIKDNNKKSSTGRGRIIWEYFNMFEEIFADDKTINHGKIYSSLNRLDFPSTSSTTFPSTSCSSDIVHIESLTVAPHLLDSPSSATETHKKKGKSCTPF
ncbi:uncharacterized protein [Diabrotica undecimpunctata]|uniref:uncharacterized protein n=1 Tax=Diabrotica undecimpunctata TaxID=50387 RepID=UPI003B640266